MRRMLETKGLDRNNQPTCEQVQQAPPTPDSDSQAPPTLHSHSKHSRSVCCCDDDLMKSDHRQIDALTFYSRPFSPTDFHRLLRGCGLIPPPGCSVPSSVVFPVQMLPRTSAPGGFPGVFRLQPASVFTTAGPFLTGCVQDGESELIPRRGEINGNQERLARSRVVITHAIGSDSTGMWLICAWLYQHSIRGL